MLTLLRNQVYIGHMVQSKREVISFKTKKVRQNDLEDWIIVENTHKPIVSMDLWYRVQQRLTERRKSRATKKDTVGLFSSLIFCADCDSPLAYMRKALKESEIGVYRCSRYNNNGGSSCSTHYIQEDAITEVVLNDILFYAEYAASDREQLTNRLLKAVNYNKNAGVRELQAKLKETEKRIKKIASTAKGLYEDKDSGKMPKDMVYQMLSDYNKEQKSLEETLPELRKQIDTMLGTEQDVSNWVSLIHPLVNIEELDRATAMELIESITVCEGKKVGKKRTQEIQIKYRFVGNLQQQKEKSIAI